MGGGFENEYREFQNVGNFKITRICKCREFQSVCNPLSNFNFNYLIY